MADDIKTTPTAYELHIGDKVVSKDGRHGKITWLEQPTPLLYNLNISYADDFTPQNDDDYHPFDIREQEVVDFNKATEKSLKECCPDLYRINAIVFGNRLTAEEIQTEILDKIDAKNGQIEAIKRETDYLRKRAWRLKYQMPETSYGTPINQESEDKDE